MKICVYGLWHLGCVTAACLAQMGHRVIGLDQDQELIGNLNQGIPPIFEPGLEELIKRGLASGSLVFSSDFRDAMKGCRVVWVAFDTPVDEDDRADTKFVMDRIELLFPFLEEKMLVLISSQMPVRSTREIMGVYHEKYPQRKIHFAYSPENLRLGKAIEVFTHPDRVVAGCGDEESRALIEEIFRPISPPFEWMSIESAEMTKHALNAFLAASVAFINDIAALCERVGADAKEVESGLKSDSRIGPKAYLSPGGAFSGGTLARDLRFLEELSRQCSQPSQLLDGVERSNAAHRLWAVKRLLQLLGDFHGRKIAFWGLTYKAGTDTLRRSGAIEICRELAEKGAEIQAFDPALEALPDEYSSFIQLFSTAEKALNGADALIIYTDYPEYKKIDKRIFLLNMKDPVVLDANRCLKEELEGLDGVQYITVGKGG